MTQNPFSPAKLWRDSIALIIGQLTQGVTPQKIALSVALGLSLGFFPIIGTTTMLCAIAALRFRLNQPIIQLVNWLVYPLQLALILVFIRIGEWITHAPHVSLSIPYLFQKFHEAPANFFQEFGMSALRGVIAWLFIAPVLTAVTYAVVLPSLKKLAAVAAAIAKTNNAC
jgi:uncharacterized protein (DUF2062 family)